MRWTWEDNLGGHLTRSGLVSYHDNNELNFYYKNLAVNVITMLEELFDIITSPPEHRSNPIKFSWNLATEYKAVESKLCRKV